MLFYSWNNSRRRICIIMFSKEISSSIHFCTDNNNKNQHVRMNYEGSGDTQDWSNGSWKFSFVITGIFVPFCAVLTKGNSDLMCSTNCFQFWTLFGLFQETASITRGLTNRSGPGISANRGSLVFLNQASSTGFGPELLHRTGETGFQ